MRRHAQPLGETRRSNHRQTTILLESCPIPSDSLRGTDFPEIRRGCSMQTFRATSVPTQRDVAVEELGVVANWLQFRSTLRNKFLGLVRSPPVGSLFRQSTAKENRH